MLGGSNKVVVPDKSETSAFPGVPVSRYVDITNFTTSFEYTTQILRRCAVCEIINFQRHHAVNTRRWSSVTHYVFLFVMLLTNRTTFIYFLVSVMTNCRNKMASNNYGATQITSAQKTWRWWRRPEEEENQEREGSYVCQCNTYCQPKSQCYHMKTGFSYR